MTVNYKPLANLLFLIYSDRNLRLASLAAQQRRLKIGFPWYVRSYMYNHQGSKVV